MLSELDPIFLSRLQFAFTVSFHIIFPAFTIGLASWLAVLEWQWLKTGKSLYKDLYKFWSKIFAVAFGMGVVSGLVMSYQFGTNWSVFADKVGPVIGPLLGYEVLTAFFLEASFLGIMLFGWGRVSPRMHFASTVIVAVGTLISAFWILAANSWMQTPTGHFMGENGIYYPESWIHIIFNPSFPYRYFHMISSAYLSTAFVATAVGSWYLLKNIHVKHAQKMIAMGMFMVFFVAPTQLIIGHQHGENTLKYQPAKVAAMEGIWENETGANLRLFGIPNETTESTTHALVIPKGASLILTGSLNGEVKGLKNWPKEERPPVAIVFYAFRIMVGIGMLMIFMGFLAGYLYYKKKLFQSKFHQVMSLLMAPSGFIAILAGWTVTEVGRQPYVAYGLLRTSESVSPVLPAYIALSLLAFIIVYTFIFGAGIFYIFKIIRKGPVMEAEMHETYGAPGLPDYAPAIQLKQKSIPSKKSQKKTAKPESKRSPKNA